MARSIFGVGLIFVIIQVALLMWLNTDGVLSRYEQSEFFTFFVMLQFWNMFNAKAYMTGCSAFKGLLSDYTFLAVCALIVVGQCLVVSFGGVMCNVVPLSLGSWLQITVATSVVLWVGEIVRLFPKKQCA